MCYYPPKYWINYFLTEKCANKNTELNHQVPGIKTWETNL